MTTSLRKEFRLATLLTPNGKKSWLIVKTQEVNKERAEKIFGDRVNMSRLKVRDIWVPSWGLRASKTSTARKWLKSE